VNNELKKLWTYMMELLYWHLHAQLRLFFILQVSELMFFCQGLAFCHISVVVRDHALPTFITTYFKHCIHLHIGRPPSPSTATTCDISQ